MTHRHVEVRPGAYADSVRLLQVSRTVAAEQGIRTAQVAMATELNLGLLADLGFDVPATTPNDLVVALVLEDENQLDDALAAVDRALADRGAATSGAAAVVPHRTVATALRDASPGSLVLVSVPGENALPEAMDALDAGHDVMLFSDNVPLDQEVALKQRAQAHDLIVLGPDCGTAVVDGVGLGFANVATAPPGEIGLVAASGTGAQQVLALLDHAGLGVRSAWGVGGRDLSVEVAARSTREALRRLDADPETRLALVISKPPAAEVAAALRQYAAGLRTEVRLALLGPGEPDLTQATEDALRAVGRDVPAWPTWGNTRPAGAGDRLVGLFVGGTLCSEARIIATDSLGPSAESGEHEFIDFGEDELTRGRAHPMIDPTLRNQRIAELARDGSVGCLLLDVVLGYAAEGDPSAGLAPLVADVAARCPVVVACVGTEADPQGLTRQASALAEAGAEVHLSNAAAARRAVALVDRRTTRTEAGRG